MNYQHPFPYPVFELFCKFAAWDYIAQDDVVNWSPFRRNVTRFLCGLGMMIAGRFWWYR